MQQQLQIKFHGVDSSPAVVARIQEAAAQLERLNAQVTSFRVTVEVLHEHQHHGNVQRVRLNMHLPGMELVVSHSHERGSSHDGVLAAVRDAFEAAKQQLEVYRRRRVAHVQRHALHEGDVGALMGYY